MSKNSFFHWRPHPWHGLTAGDNPPSIVHAYIEITPFDLIKYEIDKNTGYLKVDRPQRGSSSPPALYGFIPKTYCGSRVAKLCPEALSGDNDPLDICVFSERPITKSEIMLNTRVLGGIQMIDGKEADDKIIGVLENDSVWGGARKLADLPPALLERLRHYFSTYKLLPGEKNKVKIKKIYDVKHAEKVVRAALEDYEENFSD